jgi:hypothetical protein
MRIMPNAWSGAWLAAALLTMQLLPNSATAQDTSSNHQAQHGHQVRVLLVTGGHAFEREPFLKLFRDNPEITFEAVEHPHAHAQLEPKHARNYDVIVAYDMYQEISNEAETNFLFCTTPSLRTKPGRNIPGLLEPVITWKKPQLLEQRKHVRLISTTCISTFTS